MKLLSLLSISLIISMGLFAQVKPKPVAKTGVKKSTPVKSKKSVTAKKKTTSATEFEEVICYQDGPCTFNIIKRDTLVYEVNDGDRQYNLFVIPNKFEANTLADFNWRTTGAEKRSGHVVINSNAINTGKRYLLNLPAGELKLSDASSLWLTNLTFKEITKGESFLTLDNSQEESFRSPEADAVAIEIKYKGKQLNIEGFAIENKPEGETGRKELWILNISTNLLIIKSGTDSWSMVLKEVRKRKL